MDYNECRKMLEDFKKLSISQPRRRKTFMDVSGYPHYENVASNILAFFFDDSEEHDFGNLWLNSLLSCAKRTNLEDAHAAVEREVFTSKNNRIDLLITSDHYILCIENKLFADVYNDLKDYAKFVRDKEEAEQLEQVNIVLSLRKQGDLYPFCNVTYAELFDAVRQRLGAYIDQSDSTWILYMRDFMAAIEALQEGKNEMNIDFEKFYMQNYSTIAELDKVKSEVFNSFKEDVKIVQGKTEEYLTQKGQVNVPFGFWNSPKFMRCSFFTDFHMPGAKETYYSIETSRYACGWCITLYERHCNSGEAINWLKENDLRHHEVSAHVKEAFDLKKHHFIDDFPIENNTVEFTKVAEQVYKLIMDTLKTEAEFSLYRKK